MSLKKYLSIALGAGMTILFLSGGCATVETSKNFAGNLVGDGRQPVALISVENYGYYLFGIWPVIAGNPARPNENDTVFFEETVTAGNNLKMLTDTAAQMGATGVESVASWEYWTGSFSLWIFWLKTENTTGIAVKQPKSAKK